MTATSSLGIQTYVGSKSLARFCCEFLNLQRLAESVFSKLDRPGIILQPLLVLSAKSVVNSRSQQIRQIAGSANASCFSVGSPPAWAYQSKSPAATVPITNNALLFLRLTPHRNQPTREHDLALDGTPQPEI